MQLGEWKRLIKDSDNIVFFGGAGTSTESGIPDFRSKAGLFQASGGKASPEEILSRDYFMQHTKAFYNFYTSKMIYRDARPNAGHYALAELERVGRLRAIITQNIDGLHQQAGSSNVLELHGSVHRNHCMACQRFYSLDQMLQAAGPVPHCSVCRGIIKPDVVLYQENLDFELLGQAASYIEQADVLIVAGTSLTVQPAAGLIRYYQGNKFVLINKGATSYDGRADFLISDSISAVLTAIVTD
ncbi:NAD-dependent protein deacylase [Paenibacillus sp. y28]|uniref:NAD-dependent protein deacylase n=1 Tax=Paenibacillus sp. y28 TaxID=3129110 RepID=UPI003016F58F